MRLQTLGTLVVGLLVGCDGTAGLDELRDGGPEPSLVTDGGFIGDSGTVERDAGLDVDAGFEKTFGLYSREPYRAHVELVEPRVPPSPDEVRPFPCGNDLLIRSPKELKGEGYVETTEATVCSSSGCC